MGKIRRFSRKFECGSRLGLCQGIHRIHEPNVTKRKTPTKANRELNRKASTHWRSLGELMVDSKVGALQKGKCNLVIYLKEILSSIFSLCAKLKTSSNSRLEFQMGSIFL